MRRRCDRQIVVHSATGDGWITIPSLDIIQTCNAEAPYDARGKWFAAAVVVTGHRVEARVVQAKDCVGAARQVEGAYGVGLAGQPSEDDPVLVAQGVDIVLLWRVVGHDGGCLGRRVVRLVDVGAGRGGGRRRGGGR